MAHDTSRPPTKSLPVPKEYTIEADIHTVGFEGGVTFEVRHPHYDRTGRLWGEIVAKLDGLTVNQAQINLLDVRQRIDFHQVAMGRDGRVDWQDYLLSIIPPLQAILDGGASATADPSVSCVGASPGAFQDWPVPLPLPDSLPRVEAFEPTLLPKAFRPWIMDIADRMQCPPDFPAVSAVEGLATVVGRRVGIRPKRRDDWLVVPNLWGGVIGRPGVLKTPAIQEPLRPLWRLEFDAEGAYADAVEQWQVQQVIAKEAEKVASGKIREALKKGLDASHLAETLLASQGSSPMRRCYLVNDSTVEKLGELLNHNPQELLVFRDELTGLLRTLDREGHESDRAFYLEAWNGTGRFIYDRIGRGTVTIEAACVSILGGFSPDPWRIICGRPCMVGWATMG